MHNNARNFVFAEYDYKHTYILEISSESNCSKFVAQDLPSNQCRECFRKREDHESSKDHLQPQINSRLSRHGSFHESLGRKLGRVVKKNIHDYPTNITKAIEQLEFNIVVMGSPRVGKSQLINALSGGKVLAKTSTSLNSCTKNIEKYVLETNEDEIPDIPSSKVNFYDTPGVESWVYDAGKQSMLDFIEQTDPVCVIYCASPGSFADLSQIRFVLQKCKEKHIVCALLCTNMWDGNRAQYIIQEFEKELEIFGSSIEKYSNQLNSSIRHKVTFFGNGALCTMVNSKEYYNLNWSAIPKGVQGVDELIHGIMELLDEKKLEGWCIAVLNRRSFWEKICDNTNGFFQSRLNDVKNIKKETVVSTALLVAKIAFKWYIK